MTVFEMTKALAPTIRMLADKGITINHVEYVAMYADWLRLKDEGHKKVYAVAYLAEKYDVSEPNVWKWLRIMGKEV